MAHRCMRLAVLATVVAAALINAAGQSLPSSGPASSPTSSSKPTTLRVASYNMNYGLTGKDDFATYVAIIRKARPEVLAIQEGNEDLYKYLQAQLAKDYPHQKYVPGQAACGLGWLSKSPLQHLTQLPKIEGGWFGTYLAEIDVNRQTFLLVDIHLMATVPRGKQSPVEWMALMASTEAQRDKEVRHIHDAVAKRLGERPLPVVMLGDFNSLPGLKAPTFLASKGYIDSAASVSDSPAASWRYVWTDANWSMRIDYIFHNALLRATASGAVQDGPSDHCLIWSDLKLAPATKPATGNSQPTTHNPLPSASPVPGA